MSHTLHTQRYTCTNSESCTPPLNPRPPRPQPLGPSPSPPTPPRLRPHLSHHRPAVKGRAPAQRAAPLNAGAYYDVLSAAVSYSASATAASAPSPCHPSLAPPAPPSHPTATANAQPTGRQQVAGLPRVAGGSAHGCHVWQRRHRHGHHGARVLTALNPLLIQRTVQELPANPG